ncbi:MAG TPA: type I-U CRISPR-associated protein Csb2 [Planctomycetaceae bacterium]|nr:type I-U CRISPR-associated protein Csb2 [Planctomycetaceae bacterium]
MASQFCVSMTFLDGAFHGRGDGGEPEWPPSPLRVFQACVAAAARAGGDDFSERSAPAIRWWETLPPPTIVAAPVRLAAPYRLSVPNNAMDLVGRAWTRGNSFGDGDANPATHRAMKTVQPNRCTDGDTVHYLWALPSSMPDAALGHLETLLILARQVVVLGWGVDLVAGGARLIREGEPSPNDGETWRPGFASARTLRVPIPGTLDALSRRHAAFLNRCRDDGFQAVPSLSADGFDRIGYRRAFEPPSRPVAAFSLLTTDGEQFRSFDTVRRTCAVAGMLRHAAGLAAADGCWTQDRIARVIFGHGEKPSDSHEPVGPERFAYLPLPSLEGRGPGKRRVVGSIRRAIVTSFSENCRDEVRWSLRALSGQELIGRLGKQDEAERPQAILTGLPASDRMVRSYTEPAATWATVTPVILPGRDDHHQKKAERLLRKAIRQAGYSELLAEQAELEWRNVAFWPGADLATRYTVPSHLQGYPRFHVRITWNKAPGEPIAIPGPVCIGGGRHYGLGLFAAVAATD